MVKRINESFNDSDHTALKVQKMLLANELGLKSISWNKYLLHISGVKKLK